MATLTATATGFGYAAVDSCGVSPTSAEITARAFSTTVSYWGQSFTVRRNTNIVSVRLLLRKVGTPSSLGYVQVQIRPVSGTFGTSNVPSSGSDITPQTGTNYVRILGTSLTTSFEWYTFTFPTDYRVNLNANDAYAIHVSWTGTASNTNTIEIGSVASLHEGNAYSGTSAPVYTAQSYDLAFVLESADAYGNNITPRPYTRPYIVAAGDVAAVTSGNLTVTLPTHQAKDILILTVLIWAPNTGTWANISTPSGWTLIGSSTGSIANGEYRTYWRRATASGTTDPTVSRPAGWDTGDDTCFAGRAYVVRGPKATNEPTSAASLTTGTASRPQTIAVSDGQPGDTIIHFLSSAGVRSFGAPPVTYSSAIATTGHMPTDEVSTSVGTGAAFGAFVINANNALAPGTRTTAIQSLSAGRYALSYLRFTAVTSIRTIEEFGLSDIVTGPTRRNTTTSGLQVAGTTSFAAGQSLVGDGRKIGEAGMYVSQVPTTQTGISYQMEIWSHTGTFGTSSIPDQLLATSATRSSLSRGLQMFQFTGANKITLTNGTNYVLVFRMTGSASAVGDIILARALGSVAGNRSYTTTGTWSAFTDYKMFFVGRVTSAVGARVVRGTASGSGTGTATAINPATTKRTATGSGIGSQLTAIRCGRFRTGFGSGGATTADTAIGASIPVRTATGTGTSDSNNSTTTTLFRTATDSGSGSDTATGISTPVRSATGSGTGTSQNSIVCGLLRTGQGDGGSWNGELAWAVVIPVRTATGTGTGSESASGNVSSTNALYGSVTGVSISTGSVITTTPYSGGSRTYPTRPFDQDKQFITGRVAGSTFTLGKPIGSAGYQGRTAPDAISTSYTILPTIGLDGMTFAKKIGNRATIAGRREDFLTLKQRAEDLETLLLLDAGML